MVEQTRMTNRSAYEKRIKKALEGLAPDGLPPEDEGGAPLLARFCRWAEAEQVPIDEIGRLCGDLEQLIRFRVFLGDAKFFDSTTVGGMVALYRAAADILEAEYLARGYQKSDSTNHAEAKRFFNYCFKKCEFPKPARGLTEETPEEQQEPEKTPKKKAPRVLSKNNKTRGSKKNPKYAAADVKKIKEIVAYLNQKTGRRFQASSRTTKEHIHARLAEGYTLEDFKRVIDDRCFKWDRPPEPGKADMRDFLRPETLFCTKFEGYLNAAPAAKAEDALGAEAYRPMERKEPG